MLKETITDPEQNLRVFSDMDCTTHLRVWYTPGAPLTGARNIREFRLIYNALKDTHGILWRHMDKEGDPHDVYAHIGVDDGEDKCCYDTEGERIRMPVKQATQPVLNGVFEQTDSQRLAEDFMKRAAGIDADVARFVYEKILAFPEAQYVSPPPG